MPKVFSTLEIIKNGVNSVATTTILQGKITKENGGSGKPSIKSRSKKDKVQ